jgi:isocitrate dehydrogenase
MRISHITVPPEGQKIVAGQPTPAYPIIPFIEGDGIGMDIVPVMRKVVDAAVANAYAGKSQIAWMQLYAGEVALQMYGEPTWLPQETLDALKEHPVSIKGPLATPAGSGIRSLNAALRQGLDLYLNLRPIRYFKGMPSSLKHPEQVDLILFRENTADVAAGTEWIAEAPNAAKFVELLKHGTGIRNVRFPSAPTLGNAPISRGGRENLIRGAIKHAIAHQRKSVAFVNDGGFGDLGYTIARNEFNARPIAGSPYLQLPESMGDIVIKDVSADALPQAILLNPQEYDVIANTNLNGDYIANALAAQIGCMSIAPSAHISDQRCLFEAAPGTAPKLAGMDIANPVSIILAAEMMLRHIGWGKAAEFINQSMEKVIADKIFTQDLAQHIKDACKVKCSEFGDAMIARM